MNTVAVLEAARTKIADPLRWTQDVAARDEDGEQIAVRAGPAVCWCAIGVVALITDVGAGYNAALDLLKNAARKLHRRDWWFRERSVAQAVAEVNDHRCGDRARDHARVLAMFDLAIKAARAEAA